MAHKICLKGLIIPPLGIGDPEVVGVDNPSLEG